MSMSFARQNGLSQRPSRKSTSPKHRNRTTLLLEMLEERAIPAVDFLVNNDWGHGLQAQITVNNDTGSTLNDWRLSFEYDRPIANIWNAEILSHDGDDYVLGPAHYNVTLATGGSVNIGFVAGDGDDSTPQNFDLSEATPDTNISGIQADFRITNDWGSGFTAGITITNNGDATVRGWELEFDFPANITNLWGGKITGRAGNHYTVENAHWNGTIAPGSKISFGFNARRGAQNPEPTNYLFNGSPLGDGPGNPTLPSLSIQNVSILEGDSGTKSANFKLVLSKPSNEVVSVDYTTTNGTATEGSDYQSRAGTLTFTAGQVTKTLSVSVLNDTVVEDDETFFVDLSNVTGATLATNRAQGTIRNNDEPPVVVPEVSVGDASIIEGTGTTSFGHFSTQGNQIVDAQGRSVKIAGVNWFGMETPNYAPHGLWTRGYKDMMDQMRELGFNTIRLPFSNQLFDSGSVPNGIDFSQNPDLQGLTGLQIMDKIVDYAGEIGLRIFLDHHRSDAGAGAQGSGLWYTNKYPEQRWIDDWVMLASRYANNPTIIGADLHNEPHGAATWGTGGPNDWRLAAERAGNAVLEVNPDWLIIVGGIDKGPSGNYWWGGNLSSAGQHPVRLNVANRLVYSPHDYPASIYPQQWFNDANYPNNLYDVWDANWGYLFRQNVAPIILGEFGSKLQTTSDRQWLDTMTNYLSGDLDGNGTSDLQAGQQGVSWTWWSWNPNSGDTGGILKDDWRSVHQNKVDALKPIQFDLPDGNGGPTTQILTFTVSLSQPTTVPVTVDFNTFDVTATAGVDYRPTNGTLTFAPGQTSLTISVVVFSDDLDEDDETFTLELSNLVGGTFLDDRAIGTVLDDD
ncbi:MAG: cellulase family glycosylhydrolase [Gemmataceae bacterium]